MSNSIFPIRVKKKTIYIWLGVMFVLVGVSLWQTFRPNPKVQQSQTGLSPLVGNQAPDFILPAFDNGKVSLSQFQDQPVLINFWASWCLPCQQEMPELVRAYEAHKSEGFVILGVNLTYSDTLPEIQAFVKEFNITFPVLLDKDGTAAQKLYRILGLPTSIFVNRDGTIARIQIGLMTGRQIDRYVAEILK